MKWITRAHIHVDRVACPWLIKRFIDTNAEFIFVAKDLVEIEAVSLGAIPFDAPGVELGHHDGHCSFVSMIQKYRLNDPAILKLAEVVNAADTDSMESSAFASGLEAIAVGYSLLYPDDNENIRHQFQVYDALYNYFRLKGTK